MWLTSSSVGRKFIMALTGACLVLFVTFHCLMNSVAIVWPSAYNVICEFLGANWYALVASLGLALLFVVHIIYALWLTIQNRKARGNARYAVTRRPKTVEWSSQNMLVLGIVVLAFLGVHLIQFWARMQLVEIRSMHEIVPPTAGTLFIQEAFALPWTGIVYLIGFIALWFHFNHGFWSMFQSVGWDSTVWIPRLKKISCWWTTIVIGLFVAQAAIFTYNANRDYYKTDPTLRDQYMGMVLAENGIPAEGINYEQLEATLSTQLQQLNSPVLQEQLARNPEAQKEIGKLKSIWAFIQYLNNRDPEAMPEATPNPYDMMSGQNSMPPSAPQAGAAENQEVSTDNNQ